MLKSVVGIPPNPDNCQNPGRNFIYAPKYGLQCAELYESVVGIPCVEIFRYRMKNVANANTVLFSPVSKARLLLIFTKLETGKRNSSSTSSTEFYPNRSMNGKVGV